MQNHVRLGQFLPATKVWDIAVPKLIERGKKVFDNQCAKCHQFDGRGNTVGPNLDDAFAGDRAQHFKQSTIQNIVLDQIRLGSGPLSSGKSKTEVATQMPSNLVTGQDAQDVAAYVASVAGK